MRQPTEKVKSLLGGKIALERRNRNPMLYARARVQGKQLVYRTGETSILNGTRLAEDWYLSLLDRVRKGEQIHGRTFVDIAERFIAHCDRNNFPSALQRRNYRHKLSLLRDPYLNGVRVMDIDADWLDSFRVKRADTEGSPKPTTIKKDLDFIRLVLRHAMEREKCLESLPQFPSFRGSWQIVSEGRPFFNTGDYRKLIRVAWQRTREQHLNPRTKYQRLELYWLIHIMVGAALRVGEAQSIRWKDCFIDVLPDDDKTNVLYLKVLGKHSKGGKREQAYGTPIALGAWHRLRSAREVRGELKEKDETSIFKEHHRDGFRMLLELAKLREHAETGQTRDLKSLRPTGISLRLDETENPDYRDIAKWARTSPAMIAKFYDQTHPQHSVTRVMGSKRKRKK
jgi:hypothetical protein